MVGCQATADSVADWNYNGPSTLIPKAITMNRVHACCLAILLGLTSNAAQAEVLAQAETVLKIPLVAKPTSRPITVAYLPDYSRYYIADGGLAPMSDGLSAPVSKSEVHVYSSEGKHLQSARPGLDNRSIYFNPHRKQLEVVTYNISSGAGFTPGTGIFALKFDATGNLVNDANELSGHNPAFGSAGTTPSFDPATNLYYAKQERSNKVLVVDAANRAPVGEITLDLEASKVRHDEVSDLFVAHTGIAGEELALLDIDHKAILVFDLKGRFVGRSTLPSTMKLRANNHYNGLGYANGLFFVYHEPEGEFGTYYGFRISDQAK